MAEVRYDCRDVVVEGVWGAAGRSKMQCSRNLAVDFFVGLEEIVSAISTCR